MKKLLSVLLLSLMAFVIALPVLAETFEAPPEEVVIDTAPTAQVVTEEPTPDPSPDPTTGPWTWGYLATIAGATAATLLIAQFLKIPLDHVWKIPTRLFVYLIALVIMVIATAYTSGLTMDSFLLTILNAFIVALAAYGSYEITFARADRT